MSDNAMSGTFNLLGNRVDEVALEMPAPIRLFERLQVTALVVGWINVSITYHEELHDRINPFLFAAALGAFSALVFLLIAMISRRRSTTCKWILLVLSATGVGPWFALLQHTGSVNAHGMLSMFQGALQLGSCLLLVTEPARAWFASRVDD